LPCLWQGDAKISFNLLREAGAVKAICPRASTIRKSPMTAKRRKSSGSLPPVRRYIHKKRGRKRQTHHQKAPAAGKDITLLNRLDDRDLQKTSANSTPSLFVCPSKNAPEATRYKVFKNMENRMSPCSKKTWSALDP
jgi:hypothetical protein